MPAPKPPSPEQRTRLAAAFAAHRPSSLADFVAAAERAGTTVPQARRAWSRGWRNGGVGAIERELAAPTPRETSAAAVTAEVVADACLRRASALGKCASALVGVASKLTVKLCEAEIADMPPAFALASLARVVSVVERCGRAATEAIEIQRLVANQPQRIVAVQHEPSAPVDLEAARIELDAAKRALDRLQRRAAPASAEAETVDTAVTSGGSDGSVN